MIQIDLDVMLAIRKMTSLELAEKIGISSARISAPPFCRVPPASGGTARGRATAQGSPRSPR